MNTHTYLIIREVRLSDRKKRIGDYVVDGRMNESKHELTSLLKPFQKKKRRQLLLTKVIRVREF